MVRHPESKLGSSPAQADHVMLVSKNVNFCPTLPLRALCQRWCKGGLLVMGRGGACEAQRKGAVVHHCQQQVKRRNVKDLIEYDCSLFCSRRIFSPSTTSTHFDQVCRLIILLTTSYFSFSSYA